MLRAGGFRLYTQKGRFVDLWLNGGAAILGHTPPNLLRGLKNTASRGLYAPYPHFTEARFIKALLKLFPEYKFRLYAAPPQELISLFMNNKAKLWRPFTDAAVSLNKTKPPSLPFLVPVLSGTQTWREFSTDLMLPLGLCVAACQSEDDLAQLPPSDALSPILLAMAARGVHDLIAASPQRARPQLPRTFKALKANTCPWQREGIYLYKKEKPDNETWSLLFDKFQQAGFLLPPSPAHPVILPGELSDGEDAKLAAVLLG